MRRIYTDLEWKCHVADDGTMNPVETDFFDGKCDSYVEGYCCQTSENGLAIYPWKPYRELAAAQAQYEADLEQIADMETALGILMGGDTP